MLRLVHWLLSPGSFTPNRLQSRNQRPAVFVLLLLVRRGFRYLPGTMSRFLPAHSSDAQVDSHDKSERPERCERCERSEIRPVTFINHDAERLQITSRDLKSINSHINSHIHAHITRRSDEEKESLLPSSPLKHYQHSGLRKDPFNALPIAQGYGIPETFDYCQ
jgi:hypothetical protein